jgi:CRP-like cAMP-binding protein
MIHRSGLSRNHLHLGVAGTSMSKQGLNGNFSGELLLRRLQKITSLSSAEVELVLSAQKAKSHSPGSHVTPDVEGFAFPRIIVAGWACRPRILPDGRCQMLSIQLPGDIVGDGGNRRPLEMSPVVALTNVRTISARPIFAAIARDPMQYSALADAVGQLSRTEEAQLIDHVVRLGRQTAVQRVGHCLLEFYYRSRAIGFVQSGCFPMPLTQEVMGDLLGLSLVHVNRVLSQLKRAGLIEMQSGVVHVRDVEKLALLADYSLPRPQGRPVAMREMNGIHHS